MKTEANLEHAKQVNNKVNGYELPVNSREFIGFKIGHGKQEPSQLQQETQQKTKTVYLADKHTIEHKGKRYTLRDVNNFVSIYETRVNDALEQGKQRLASSRASVLDYWLNRREELLDNQPNQVEI